MSWADWRPIVFMLAVFVIAYAFFRALDLPRRATMVVMVVLALGYLGWMLYAEYSAGTIIGQAVFFGAAAVLLWLEHRWHKRP